MELLVFLNKWLHLLSVIGTLGGILFARIVLADGQVKGGTNWSAALAPLWRRFGIALGVLWAIVLLTGTYNYIIVSPKVVGSYHMLAGMKIMLAVLMFLVSMLLVHPGGAGGKLQANRGPWLAVLLVMGVAVVGISAHLNLSRISGKSLKTSALVTPSAETPSQ